MRSWSLELGARSYKIEARSQKIGVKGCERCELKAERLGPRPTTRSCDSVHRAAIKCDDGKIVYFSSIYSCNERVQSLAD
jgi:hypothetical protein